ncbi:Scytalone dehydratase [Pseudozyma hubeiensis]|nr:Scytalone dehydratase [Pseudozyma hubeiensis]
MSSGFGGAVASQGGYVTINSQFDSSERPLASRLDFLSQKFAKLHAVRRCSTAKANQFRSIYGTQIDGGGGVKWRKDRPNDLQRWSSTPAQRIRRGNASFFHCTQKNTLQIH